MTTTVKLKIKTWGSRLRNKAHSINIHLKSITIFNSQSFFELVRMMFLTFSRQHFANDDFPLTSFVFLKTEEQKKNYLKFAITLQFFCARTYPHVWLMMLPYVRFHIGRISLFSPTKPAVCVCHHRFTIFQFTIRSNSVRVQSSLVPFFTKHRLHCCWSE